MLLEPEPSPWGSSRLKIRIQLGRDDASGRRALGQGRSETLVNNDVVLEDDSVIRKKELAVAVEEISTEL